MGEINKGRGEEEALAMHLIGEDLGLGAVGQESREEK